MQKRSIPWAELSHMNLAGRDLEIKFETVVQRAKIADVLWGSEVMFCLEPQGGASAPASNFTKREDVEWRPERISPYEVSCRNDNVPEQIEDGTILIRTLGHYVLVIHAEGDSLKLPVAA